MTLVTEREYIYRFSKSRRKTQGEGRKFRARSKQRSGLEAEIKSFEVV